MTFPRFAEEPFFSLFPPLSMSPPGRDTAWCQITTRR